MILLSLGSNLGDRVAYLSFAAEQLNEAGIEILKSSSIYETPPWGNLNQPGFLNQVLKIDFTEGPFQLLHTIREIENKAGRQRIEKWGARTLDIDIIEYDGLIVNDADLILPHPQVTNRLFVLIPLAEIEPLWIEGITHKTAREWVASFPETERNDIVLFQ